MASAETASLAQIGTAIFVESTVPDIQTLIDGVLPGERVFILDPDKDGLAQIASDLHAAHLKHLSAIAIVAHGAAGSLQLGASTLDDGDLGAHKAALRKIGAALGHKGKLELYACDVAAGAAGKKFIVDLSHDAGGAAVAASTHEIGRTAAGPDWTLDATIGGRLAHGGTGRAAVSQPNAPFTEAATSGYQASLGTVNDGSSSPSRRARERNSAPSARS